MNAAETHETVHWASGMRYHHRTTTCCGSSPPMTPYVVGCHPAHTAASPCAVPVPPRLRPPSAARLSTAHVRKSGRDLGSSSSGGVPDQFAMLVQLGLFDPPRAPEPAAAGIRSPRSIIGFSSSASKPYDRGPSDLVGQRSTQSDGSACTGRAMTLRPTGGRLRRRGVLSRSPRADMPRLREGCAQPSANRLARIDKGEPLADPYRVMCVGRSRCR